jgi:Ca2+-transporting ATPase
MPVEDCLSSLEVSEKFGLSCIEANHRIQRFGANKLPEPKKKSIWKLIAEQFEDSLVQILLSVAVLSSILAAFERDSHALTEPSIILAILILNAFVGIWQNKSAESSLQALKKLQPDTATVLRDGRWDGNFPTEFLVPGDIIYLRVGDKVPADARIISLKTNSFSTDEGSLTGESISISKSANPVSPAALLAQKTSMVFSGTMVASGAAYAVVVNTGEHTEIGRINAGVEEAKESTMKTPLTLQLDEFGDQLTKIIGAICLTVWLASIPKFHGSMFSSWYKGALHYGKVAVALGVAAIPEGLPAVITLCLSLGTRKMAKKNVIVRKLSSVETLGCTSVICTDKTGTLTTNQMTVKSLVTFGDLSESAFSIQDHEVEGISYEPHGLVKGLSADSTRLPGIQMIAKIATLCNEAKLELREGRVDHIGEPTEAALKVLVEKLGHFENNHPSNNLESMIQQHGNRWASQYDVLSMLEFSRDRKSMSVLAKPKSRYGQNVLFVKGAAEMVLARCSKLMMSDGRVVEITERLRKELESKLKDMAGKPLRCLALAFKSGDSLGELNGVKSADEAATLPILKDASRYVDLESDLTLAGICGIKDPARPEAAEAMLKCRDAGIRVMMITGDSKETAIAIAKDVNILTNNDDLSTSAFSGHEFFSLPPNTQLKLLKTGNKVFCRTEPRDKQKLITMLEKLGEIPAMTGDGVNDAPALQQAAIGIAMGITGTEVAKSAADMILADDNFSTIVNAVEEGRNIYANMQAFICFLISCNMGEIATMFLSTLLGLPEPLASIHLLWVNLVTDGPPATALGFNPADPASMSKPPRSKNEPLLSKWLLVRYAVTGLYVGLATIGAFSWWFIDKGVTFNQLRHWSDCLTWKLFAHSADAPFWPMEPCNIFSGHSLRRPQTMALSVLVSIEMLKALSAVSLDRSLVSVPPWKNKWLVWSVLIPVLMHLSVIYIPLLSNIFGLAPLTWDEWKVRR